MIDEFRAAFQELIDASVATDTRRFPPAVHKVYTLASQVPADERALALEALVPLLGGTHSTPGVTADLTVVAGAMVEMGTPPGEAGIAVLRRLRTMGEGATVFLQAWQRSGNSAPPDPEEVTSTTEQQVSAELGDTAPQATVCWWTIRRHGLAAKTMLSESRVRAAVRADPELHTALVTVADQLGPVLWEFEDVAALLQLTQTVNAVVLDRTSGRGFRVEFDGVSDNYQLHTLLADALVGENGQGLAGHRPDTRWVAAFTDSATDPEAPTVQGWWNLTAVDGSGPLNDGTPADIPTIDGEPVVVLDELDTPATWTAGRHYPQVPGWLEVSHELNPQQTTQWWHQVTRTEVAAKPVQGTQPAEPALEDVPAPPPSVDSTGPAGPAERAEPAPEEVPAPPPATDVIPTVAATPDDGDEGPHPSPSPTAEDADETEDHDDSAPAPGARHLPPLPPGVSNNSGWGPTWL